MESPGQQSGAAGSGRSMRFGDLRARRREAEYARPPGAMPQSISLKRRVRWRSAKRWFPRGPIGNWMKRRFPGGPTGEWANGGPPSNAASVRGAVQSVRTSAGASSSPPIGAGQDAEWKSPSHSSRPNRSAARVSRRRPLRRCLRHGPGRGASGEYLRWPRLAADLPPTASRLGSEGDGSGDR
jgi:hypothetical protein